MSRVMSLARFEGRVLKGLGPEHDNQPQIPGEAWAAARMASAAIAFIGIVGVFIVAAISTAGFEVHRSNFTHGALERAVPPETTQVFQAIANAETCANQAGIGAAQDIPPIRRGTVGRSRATATIWREGCGGASLSIAITDANRDAAAFLVETFTEVTTRMVQGTLAPEDAARHFHLTAHANDIGHRLIGWQVRER